MTVAVNESELANFAGFDGVTVDKFKGVMGFRESTSTRRSKNGTETTKRRLKIAAGSQWLRISFRGAAGELSVHHTVRRREYDAAAAIVQLVYDGDAVKPIVFCPGQDSCRRTMALVLELVVRRLEWAERIARGLPRDADTSMDECIRRLRSLKAGHVYKSWTHPPEPRLKNQDSAHRDLILAEYEASETFVLFNTSLLETGADFPHCDAVVSVKTPTEMCSLLQRWGRALRVDRRNPDKRGIFVFVCPDPGSYQMATDVALALAGVEAPDTLVDVGMREALVVGRALERLKQVLFSDDVAVVSDVWWRTGHRYRASGGRGGSLCISRSHSRRAVAGGRQLLAARRSALPQ